MANKWQAGRKEERKGLEPDLQAYQQHSTVVANIVTLARILRPILEQIELIGDTLYPKRLRRPPPPPTKLPSVKVKGNRVLNTVRRVLGNESIIAGMGTAGLQSLRHQHSFTIPTL